MTSKFLCNVTYVLNISEVCNLQITQIESDVLENMNV